MYPDYNYNRYASSASNVSYVTSLEEALSRNSYPNSENVYFHQDKPIFYRVRTDSSGKKFWQEFEYVTPTPAENTIPATRQDLTEIVQRIQRIEERVFSSEVQDEQPNG